MFAVDYFAICEFVFDFTGIKWVREDFMKFLFAN